MEQIIDHDVYYNVMYTGEDLEIGQLIMWVLDQDIDAQPAGSECQTFYDSLEPDREDKFTGAAPDYGGYLIPSGTVENGFLSNLRLEGTVDAVDPLSTDNVSPTGTFYMCLKSAHGGWTLYRNLQLHTRHQPRRRRATRAGWWRARQAQRPWRGGGRRP